MGLSAMVFSGKDTAGNARKKGFPMQKIAASLTPWGNRSYMEVPLFHLGSPHTGSQENLSLFTETGIPVG